MSNKYYDNINDLPIDKKMRQTEIEIELIDTIFKGEPSTLKVLIDEIKEPLIVGVLFVLFSLQYVESVTQSLLPLTNNSPIFIMITKVIFIMILFWIIKHFNLSRNI
jgi:hypothetical protein